MMQRPVLASLLGCLIGSALLAPSGAYAGEGDGEGGVADPEPLAGPQIEGVDDGPEQGAARPVDSQRLALAESAPDPAQPPEKERHRLFPLGGRAAIARGYRIPEPWGLGALMVWTDTRFDTRNLSAAVRKGGDPSPDVQMTALPSVTTHRLEGDNRLMGFKADLWLFPGVNFFASIGKVKGNNRIDVDVDLDQVVPFPFCRPAKPCGTVRLPIDTRVSNTTVTLGTILVYGNEKWFVLGTVAKTVSISSKQRSDVESTNLGLRGGTRFRLGENTYLAPYFGANYFDLDTTVKGVVASGPLFEDGEGIHLRYKVDMSARKPWAAVAGFNVELSRHLTFQAELQAGAESTRILASTGVRF
ncbi:porin family protein [Novosphingobium guangzhouense]|nr:porin family protein [Novosphingobium guangzhouense]